MRVPQNGGRFLLIPFVLSGLFVLCFVRAFDLMINLGSQYRAIADENRFFTLPVTANRGIIFDRSGNMLLHNEPEFYYASTSAQRLFADAWSLTLVPPEDLPNFLQSSASSVFVRSRRSSDIPASLSHSIGLTGYADTIAPDSVVRPDDRVGKSGVEKWFDSKLQGKDGKEEVEVSALGVIQRSIRVLEPPVDGADITLSLDESLSDVAFESLDPHPGAVVVTDIPTGQVLVLTSSPSFTPLTLSNALHDATKPLINRAITSFPPGSTFKLMTALTALRAGTITKDTIVDDEGEIKAGTQIFGNWYWRQYGRKEGNISLVRAIARSNDIYFYKTAESVGPDLIDAMAQEFGYGKSTGIELPSESVGLLPNSAWKEKKVGEKWYLGDTYNMGIGQGYILATPVQVNNMTATVARRGSWCPLTLTLSEDPSCTDADVDPQHMETVIQGMVEACSTGGTAFPFFPLNEQLPDEKKIACKTGTAEFGGEDAQGRKRTHGWFTMFYPKEKPKVAITVFLESTPDRPFLEGSKDGAPIALKVFEKWKETYDK